jgi:MOSC domain-containing protein YiiM
MPALLTVNLGTPRPTLHSDLETTGIDKRPHDGPVLVRRPSGQDSGIDGDVICDVRHHGGVDQAVYAYAREDLDAWVSELGRDLRSGMFGENLTTVGMDVTNARIGERWRVGEQVLLEVSTPRIPCRTFAGWLDEHGWIKTFTQRAWPGAYLRVIEPGMISAGDPIEVVHRPEHGVTIGTTFRALTTEPELLPEVTAADAHPEYVKSRIAARLRAPHQ